VRTSEARPLGLTEYRTRAGAGSEDGRNRKPNNAILNA